MAAKNTLNFRLSDDLRERLRAIGERDRRSLSFLIEDAVREFVERYQVVTRDDGGPKHAKTAMTSTP